MMHFKNISLLAFVLFLSIDSIAAQDPFEDIIDTLKPREILHTSSFQYENSIISEKRFYNYIE